ncbi:MAG: ATP-binding protein [Bacteroidota bacterium]
MISDLHSKSTVRLKGRILLLAIIALSTFSILTYITSGTYTDLLDAIEVLSTPNKNLELSKKLLNDLSLAENSLRTYGLTKKKIDYQRFNETVNNIQLDIDTLLNAADSYSPKLDSIGKLLTIQVAHLRNFANSPPSNFIEYSRSTISELERNPADSLIASYYTEIRSTTKSFKDSVVLVPKRPFDEEAKGFFKKLKVLLSKNKPDQVDTLSSISTNFFVFNDTTTFIRNDSLVLSMVKEVLMDIKQQQLKAFNRQKETELAFIEQNTAVIDNIRAIINRSEYDEKIKTKSSKANAKDLAQVSLNIIKGIIICLAIIIIIIVILIFADLSKSKFYQKRLELAKNKAERLTKIKQQFLSNMSHEIRTPLTAIIGYANLFGDHRNITDRNIEIIKSASNHLLSLVNDILDISKMESAGLTLRKASFDLNKLLKQSCDTFQFMANEKAVEIIYQPEGNTELFVQGDDVRLRQVIYNLLDNAIKFTWEGEVKLIFKTIEVGSKIECYIDIADTGVGIPEEELQYIFSDFYQSDRGHSKVYKGTGLGLAICKKLVALHGGDIQVKSIVGLGSTFSLFLPLEKGEKLLTSLPKNSVPREDLNGMNVLVVDDDAFNLELLQKIFSHEKIKVDLVSTGKKALQKLKTQSYDALITDIHMPGTDGVAIVKQIEGLHPQMKRIALTADVTQDFEKYGFSVTVTKPINPAKLFAALLRTNGQTRDREVSALNTYPEGLYDLSDIQTFAHHDPKSIKAMLDAFIETIDSDVTLIRQHLNDNNWMALSERAHKMIAPCAQLKSERLVKLLTQLETREWKSIQELEIITENIISLVTTLTELLKKEIQTTVKEDAVKVMK